MSARILIVGVLLGAAAGPTTADYLLTPLSDGLHQREVAWGESFPLDLVLTSDAADVHNSAVVQLVFTAPGLVYEAYDWAPPYADALPFDDSTPAAASLPQALTVDSYFNPLAPELVDVELSNVLIEERFGSGTLISLALRVPADFGFVGSLYIVVWPDTLADGFTEIPTTAGPVFELVVIPEPAGKLVAGAALVLALVLRRRSARRP